MMVLELSRALGASGRDPILWNQAGAIRHPSSGLRRDNGQRKTDSGSFLLAPPCRAPHVRLRPMLPLNIHHTAIAVRDLDAAVAAFVTQYGVEPLYREVVEAQGVEEAMMPIGGSYVQLLEPLGSDTPVGRFLERRGEGLHHIAFQVTDIEASLRHLESEGVPIVDEEPRIGGGGHRTAFVHPDAFGGTLIELVEIA